MVGYRAFANCTAVLPGSESRTCFHRNRSCRLVPAHSRYESRSCGLVQRIDTVGSPTPRPDPCVGQAHALQDSGCRRNDESRPFP